MNLGGCQVVNLGVVFVFLAIVTSVAPTEIGGMSVPAGPRGGLRRRAGLLEPPDFVFQPFDFFQIHSHNSPRASHARAQLFDFESLLLLLSRHTPKGPPLARADRGAESSGLSGGTPCTRACGGSRGIAAEGLASARRKRHSCGFEARTAELAGAARRWHVAGRSIVVACSSYQ